MSERLNPYGQPIGPELDNWTARAQPGRTPMTGQHCRIEPVDVARHAAELFDAFSDTPDGRDWTYMSTGPFADFEAYRSYLAHAATLADPFHYAIIDLTTHRAIGTFALMRIDAANGVIEVGSVSYSRRLQRTVAGTEALYLLMQHVFDDLGYRRLEWKCDHLNAPSRAAALRYGFQYEGIFRQAVVYKGRSRDTAWFAITDQDWHTRRQAYMSWLAPANFDAQGQQRQRLTDFMPPSGILKVTS